jgi:hypothetical protein
MLLLQVEAGLQAVKASTTARAQDLSCQQWVALYQDLQAQVLKVSGHLLCHRVPPAQDPAVQVCTGN